MIEIPTLFKRDFKGTYQVRNEVTPGCEWVLAGEGEVYRKWQGMAAMIKNNHYYKRVIIKKDQMLLPNFIPCTYKERSGKTFGWFPVDINNPQDKYYIEAFDSNLIEGTYELIGPKIHGNPEQVPIHILVAHKAGKVPNIKRDFNSIRDAIDFFNYEGLVFHHSDGRMAKIKKKDFGLVR